MELTTAKKLANEKLDEWGLSPKWSFKFDRAKRRFGCCKIGKKQITISKHLTKLNGKEDVLDTILHEIAHALDYEDRGTSDHSYKWKKWARKVGAEPTRCYDGNEVNKPDYKYYDYCPNCGTKGGRHKRRSKRKLIASCNNCGRGFDKNYIMIFNIPAKKMEQVENGELDPKDLQATKNAIQAMEFRYYENDLEDSLFYQKYK